jgi:hypothetical protein
MLPVLPHLVDNAPLTSIRGQFPGCGQRGSWADAAARLERSLERGGQMAVAALSAARALAQRREPHEMAAACGVRYEGSPDAGEFHLVFLGMPVALSWPDLEQQPGTASLPGHVLALLVYHLALSDGASPTGRRITFAELPDAMFYASAFRGYTGDALVREFGSDKRLLAAEYLGGVPIEGLANARGDRGPRA